VTRFTDEGLDKAMIAAARGLVAVDQPVLEQVSPGNAQSLRAFLSAGFRPLAEMLSTATDRRALSGSTPRRRHLRRFLDGHRRGMAVRCRLTGAPSRTREILLESFAAPPPELSQATARQRTATLTSIEFVASL